MTKYKSPQELMAARNPLARKPVIPVDIYSLPTPVEAEKPEATPELTKSKSKNKPSAAKKPASPAVITKKDGVLKSYSTYLYPSQIKAIKLRAVEHDMDDYAIVQEAVDEYFQRHRV